MAFEDQIEEIVEGSASNERIGKGGGLIFLVVQQIHEHEYFELSERISRQVADGTAEGKKTENPILIIGDGEYGFMMAGQTFHTFVE